MKGPHAAQIIAICAICRHTTFRRPRKINIRIIPTCKIKPGAIKNHGITKEWLIRNRRSQQVYSSMQDGLQYFLDFLEGLRSSEEEEILLVSVDYLSLNFRQTTVSA